MFQTSDLFSELRKGKTFCFHPHWEMVRIVGKDAKNFLHRLSTNDLTTLKMGEAIATSFTNNKGRMVDHCVIFFSGADEFIIVGSSPNDVLHDWLEQFHFAEDFILDQHLKTPLFVIVTSAKDFIKPPSSFHFWHAQLDGYEIDIFLTLSKSFGYPVIDEPSWQTLRIASLLPAFPQEINDRMMPQNINLKETIADNKGCYIGQEVIAKAFTYQKNVKSLGGAQLSLETFLRAKPGSLLVDPEGQVGEVTSLAPVYIEHEINTLVLMGKKGLTEPLNDAEVVKLPFKIKKSQ